VGNCRSTISQIGFKPFRRSKVIPLPGFYEIGRIPFFRFFPAACALLFFLSTDSHSRRLCARNRVISSVYLVPRIYYRRNLPNFNLLIKFS
jgi:hypothetical protein